MYIAEHCIYKCSSPDLNIKGVGWGEGPKSRMTTAVLTRSLFSQAML